MNKLPSRFAYGENEIKAISDVITYYQSKDEDPCYQGYFEQKFCDEFSAFMGGGYSDAVATGTASIFIALQALQLPKGSDVLISPVTDSGPLNCIILLGLNPVVIDSKKGSYNIDLEQFKKRITSNTSALLLVHTGGEPVEDTKLIVKEAHAKGIKVLEDCSQATGALIEGQRVGTFGDIAAFSTMYRKNLIAGSCGGLVFTKNTNLYHLALAYADRGKQTWRIDLNQNDPSNALFPALNLNTDEISCAIGSSSLQRLQNTIDKRVEFLEYFIDLLTKKSTICSPYCFNPSFSPFFFPIFVDIDKLTCTKVEFAKSLAEEGIANNVHYGCVISEWEWAKPYYMDEFQAKNAVEVRNNSFNLFLNENYTIKNADDIISVILDLENKFKKVAK